MLDKPILFTKVVVYTLAFFWRQLERSVARSKESWAFRLSGGKASATRDANIVIVGANFAGYQAAKVLSLNLPPGSRYRVVVVEPSSHFQFTWVLPRFCVAKGHEHKAFIPYGAYLAGAPEGAVQWIKDRVASISKSHIKLQDSGEEIPYEYLIIATGSAVDEGLPSRTNATEKLESMKRMQAMQKSIEGASRIVVVGGGAAGVEVATDAKSLYPDKTIILVHSRKKCMHRFGEGLKKAAEEGLDRLGIEVILEERVVGEDKEAGTVTLRSGRVIECDLFINCTGQRPASDILKTLAPETISESGHIKVKPSLQIDNDSFPNIYACGDVADTKTPNPNGRSAHRQGDVAADNILQVIRGKKPVHVFASNWADGIIKLTLGLDRSVTHIGDGQKELLWESKEKEEELMAARCWQNFGAKPYEDDSIPKDMITP
ncbi:hypothetical protein EDB81DRAFT_690331 [Dactylonectria macrodidyma]|uniref:FAD/NAD(P)-binding domain-containing protein n=1 Tax=Dactylonectria macrodidyma TaxID=307937 RepID=A0A9P9ETI4_9HYPO|nr:hypothetical protein EDB81DRAFT_690331 [Dactylonectria macrodidyma]